MSVGNLARRRAFKVPDVPKSAQDGDTRSRRRTPVSQIPDVALCAVCQDQAKPDSWTPLIRPVFLQGGGALVPTPPPVPNPSGVRFGVSFSGRP